MGAGFGNEVEPVSGLTGGDVHVTRRDEEGHLKLRLRPAVAQCETLITYTTGD